MRQTNEFLNFGEYEKVKFTFKGLEKYIIMVFWYISKNLGTKYEDCSRGFEI